VPTPRIRLGGQKIAQKQAPFFTAAASLQTEVLNFAEYLAAKAERETIRQEDKSWSSMSLPFAMRGMENEETPTYATSDLTVVFS
jgi:hypothetical protein